MSYYGPPPPQFQMPYQFPQTQNPKSNIGLYISSSLFLVLILISIVLIVLIGVKIIVIPGLNAPSTIDSTSTSSSSGSTTNSSSGSTVPTVRQTLTKLCPIDPAANGMINKTNLASRDNYLFGACTAAGTCDSIIPDNISKILISTLSPGGGGACGGWNQPEANPQIIWDNTNKRWNMAPAPAAVLNTKQRLSQLCPVNPAANGMINKGNDANRDDYLFSACNGAGTCDSATPDNISQILINSLSSGNFCGGWGQGSLSWDNTNKRWNNSAAPATTTTTIPTSFTLNAKTGLWSAPGDKFTCPGITNRNTTGNNGDFNNYCVFNTAQDAVAAANTISDCIGYVTFPNGYYQLIKMAPIVGGPSGSQFFSKDPNYNLTSTCNGANAQYNILGSSLQAPITMNPCDGLKDPSGKHIFVFQSDGNLVLYNTINKYPDFASGTQNQGAVTCKFQSDGNLVLYDINNTAIWATGTQNQLVTKMTMQDDGNMALYTSNGTFVSCKKPNGNQYRIQYNAGY